MIERREFSTAGLGGRRQFDAFAENAWNSGFTVERDAQAGSAYKAEVTSWRGAGFVRSVASADQARVSRRPQDVARRGTNVYRVHREASSVWHGSGAHELVTRPGDIFLGDSDAVYDTVALGRFASDVWQFPKVLLDRHLPAGSGVVMQSLTVQGVGSLVTDYLDSLSRHMNLLDGSTGEAILDNLCRLIAIACGAEAHEHGNAVRAGQLERVKRHIERHLADAALAPGTAAASMGMSVRSLHKLFEPTGTSFARYVLRRRLEECRAALTGPLAARRSVIDIAFGWGFTNLSTFYRAFERRFGEAPGEFRERHRRELR